MDRRALNIEGCHAVGGVLRPLSAHAKHAHTNGSGSSTGGPVRGSVGEQLTLRVFVDASLVEAFTSTGTWVQPYVCTCKTVCMFR